VMGGFNFPARRKKSKKKQDMGARPFGERPRPHLRHSQRLAVLRGSSKAWNKNPYIWRAGKLDD
jgi:hypothetical protein